MNNWHDIALSISVLAFNVALIPSLTGIQKPRMTTSVMTALFLVPEIIVFFSLNLWYSFAMALLNAIFWSILAYQRYVQVSNNKL